MLKKFIQLMRPPSVKTTHAEQADSPSLATIERADHNISRKHISKAALNVLYGLRDAGYEGYLVGGCIRDLLLDKRPKDFDIATNATPEQVVKLFKRSRIIGRRFKIVHVRFGSEVIEVTTFRAAHYQAEAPTDNNSQVDNLPLTNESQSPERIDAAKRHSQQNEHGMLLRDNVYGTLREDALRRDFTVNALYYTIDGFKILDHVNGLKDLNNHILRIIGDPSERYREDPVRMLRAIRFAAKLDFALEPQTAAPIAELAPLLQQVSSARMFDEINKLLLSQHALRTFELLQDYGLLKPLIPEIEGLITDRSSTQFQLIACALKNTQQRLADEKPVTPAFLYACLFWPHVEALVKQASSTQTPWEAIRTASHQALEEQFSVVSIPKRFTLMVRDIWSLQHNLEHCNDKRAKSLLTHPRFRAAYDFLIMREQAGEQLARNSQYWSDLQKAYPDIVYKPQPKKRKHSEKNRKYSGRYKKDAKGWRVAPEKPS